MVFGPPAGGSCISIWTTDTEELSTLDSFYPQPFEIRKGTESGKKGEMDNVFMMCFFDEGSSTCIHLNRVICCFFLIKIWGLRKSRCRNTEECARIILESSLYN